MPRSRCLALVLTLVAAAGCTDSDDPGAAPESTAVSPTSVAPTTSPVLPTSTTPTTAPTAETATTDALPVDEGLDPADVFLEPDDGSFRYLELDEASQAAIRDELTRDERADVFLTDVEARGVVIDDELVGSVVALAVVPSAAADSTFQTDYFEGVTQGGVRDDTTLTIGREDLIGFTTADGLRSLAWRYENVFVLISGRDDGVLEGVATAMVETLLGPIGTVIPVNDGIVEPDADTAPPADDPTTTTAG